MAVPETDRRIIAMGGGGFMVRPDDGLLDAFVLDLARERSGRDRPRICFLPTAVGDSDASVVEFYTAFADGAEPRHLALFARTRPDIGSFLLDQDIVYVGGGNTANMLAVWRVHGVDRAVRGAWEAGVVMAGVSAGAIYWFEGCTTDSFGPELRPLRDGLAVLDGSFVPHYHGEAQRRPLFHRLVADGTLPAGYGVDDGAALVYHGTELHEVVASSTEAGAYRVESVNGSIVETPLAARYLGG
jgi:peptidase E